MKYTQAQFLKLLDIVESQGGTHIDCPHDPMYVVAWAGDRLKGEEVKYCGNDTLFGVPYFAKGPTKGVRRQKETAILCAVCDEMGLMPRFSECLEEE